MGTAITDLSPKSSFPNTSAAVLYNLATGVQTIATGSFAVWSPLLHNEKERSSWEAYALQSINQSQPELCYVCGSENKILGKPNTIIQIPALQPYTCSEIEKGGLGGFISPKYCTYVQSYVEAQCDCRAKPIAQVNETTTIATGVFYLQHGRPVRVEGKGPNFPVWQVFPNIDANKVIMYDQLSDPLRGKALESLMKSEVPTFARTGFPDDNSPRLLEPTDTPVGTLFQPVFESDSNKLAGIVSLDFVWNQYYTLALPIRSDGLVVVFSNTQGQSFSFKVNGDKLEYIGKGDIHDPEYDMMFKETSYKDFEKLIMSASGQEAVQTLLYKVRIYPSVSFKLRYLTSKPAIYATVVVLIFVFTSISFILYDFLVRRRQHKVMNSAMRDDAIVSSLFPATIRERLFKDNTDHDKRGLNTNNSDKAWRSLLHPTPRAQLRRLLRQSSNGDDEVRIENDSDPIADFFPRCSIVFADITGFTAWSSEREPAQVFRLLETVYRAFDKLARKHGVFKIETIGDCYVAATGVPEAQEDHAIRICRFAQDCLAQTSELTKSLESSLGPGTGDLTIRIGIHSGPVTGGVLRGEKARFQLFGDTMNTAARMESTGKACMIQISPTTADILQQSGFAHWLKVREGGVFVKGKGDMQTFWATPTNSALTENVAGNQNLEKQISLPMCLDWGDESLDTALPNLDEKSSDFEKLERLVDWNTDLLHRLLQRIVARRASITRKVKVTNQITFKRSQTTSRQKSALQNETLLCGRVEMAPLRSRSALTPIEEVSEILTMPKFCGKTEHDYQNPDKVILEDLVRVQLRDYVRSVAAAYRDNPFHNFEHASHVALSAWKIMNRIIKPDDDNFSCASPQTQLGLKKRITALAAEIHLSTFGISSDPLMQFAVVFCALIHDADHMGVTNSQLVEEETEVAARYHNKCVAEQNSVHLCWELLLESRFGALLSCICSNDEELKRFRQLVVNAVIATDIADKELQLSRKTRWDKAFQQQGRAVEGGTGPNTEEDINRKATVVFEYIIQASDVAHTMQHWHIYSKWNERLFKERYHAYLSGREPRDPSRGWYQGELWFFDNYIIPLANKLEHCGVFGVSSDEYLNYAQENRREWEVKGKDIVQAMLENVCSAKGLQHHVHAVC